MNEYVSTIGTKKKNVIISEKNTVIVDQKEFPYTFSKISDNSYLLNIGNKVYDIAVHQLNNGKWGFLIDGHYFETTVRTTLQEKANELLNIKISKNHHDIIKAPMPGMIVKIKKNPGDSIEIGESVLILEAMKMENDMRAPSSGIIKEIFVKEGNSVEKDTILLSIE